MLGCIFRHYLTKGFEIGEFGVCPDDGHVDPANPGSGQQLFLAFRWLIAKVHNKGGAPVPASFLTRVELELSCEAGKLVSQIPAQVEFPSVEPIPAGSFRYVMLLPQSGQWGDVGCYYRARLIADPWQTVSETSELNNKGSAHFCPPGASLGCY